MIKINFQLTGASNLIRGERNDLLNTGRERRFGSGRILPRDVSWDYRPTGDKDKPALGSDQQQSEYGGGGGSSSYRNSSTNNSSGNNYRGANNDRGANDRGANERGSNDRGGANDREGNDRYDR
jgi:hypothetical protein